MEIRRFDLIDAGTFFYIFEKAHSKNLLAIQNTLESVKAYLAAYVRRTSNRGTAYEIWDGEEFVLKKNG